MIDAGHLLADLQRLLKVIEKDLRQRCQDNADMNARVQAEYNTAKSARRTSQTYEVWRDEFITQVAVAWILACVFVRFIEDNQMLDDMQSARVWLAGPGARLQLARDQHTIYFREHPQKTDREYLEHVFRAVANPTGKRPLPVVQPLFSEEHNPLWRLGLSGDGATALLNFWQQLEPQTGILKYDFTDKDWNTRFLGDLYQDLSEAARKKYALLQTPVFVEEFILDRTLTPAINEFGYQSVRLIDPTCGSGHFLLGAFARLFDLWVRNEPAVNAPELTRRALSQVYGVDLNPYALSIARFRLLIAALNASGIQRLQDAPAFEFNLAVGDSLLHGPPRGNGAGDQLNMMWSPMAHVYAAEDKEQLDRILVLGRYHAVVGNPPYITVKDTILSKAYRERFGSCHRQYSLAVPFIERFFDLATNFKNGTNAGFVGMITANSFMKREFGKKLIETYIPRWDLTHVIDTSGAYIPGHGTPTVILFGRNQNPVADTIRTVLGIKGEPTTPPEPSTGKVWTSILEAIDDTNALNEFISAHDAARKTFHKHPWSVGGGGASDLKEIIDAAKVSSLSKIVKDIGIASWAGIDEVFVAPEAAAKRWAWEQELIRPFVYGEVIRDWRVNPKEIAACPYDEQGNFLSITTFPNWYKYLWNYRRDLRARVLIGGGTFDDEGIPWEAWVRWIHHRYLSSRWLVFSFIATHNHFALTEGRQAFNRSAPVITFSEESSEDDLLCALGLLNCSTACFWMKQVLYPKATSTGDISTEKGKPEANRYEFGITALESFPVPSDYDNQLVREIVRLIKNTADELTSTEPGLLIKKWSNETADVTLNRIIELGEHQYEKRKRRMVALQEELDWEFYRIFGLVDHGSHKLIFEDNELGVEPEERPAFWKSDESPSTLVDSVRSIYIQRKALIRNDRKLKLLETAVYKRLWLGQQGVFGHANSTYNDKVKSALRDWLLDRLEDARYWPREELTTTARLADRVRKDAEFMQVAEMYRGRSDFDVANVIAELVKSESVPFLPILRYKASGLRNRQIWEQVWDLQRQEDAIDARTKLSVDAPLRLTEDEAKRLKAEQVGDIPVPPKYKSADFREGTFWRLRGKLDVPKERFISYAGCERDADSSLVIAWAGWNHLQQAQAVASYYQQMKTNEGWGPTRLVPLLAGIVELLPWLMQWHNEVDPAFGIGMGDFFSGFVEEEARALGLTVNRIRDWSPLEQLEHRTI